MGDWGRHEPSRDPRRNTVRPPDRRLDRCTGDTPTAGPRRPRRALWTFLVWAVVYVLDQVTKVLAVAHLEPGVVRPFVGDVLQFHLIRNPGAAFSFATGATWIFTVLAAVVVVVVVRMSRKLRSLPWALAFGFLLREPPAT